MEHDRLSQVLLVEPITWPSLLFMPQHVLHHTGSRLSSSHSKSSYENGMETDRKHFCSVYVDVCASMGSVYSGAQCCVSSSITSSPYSRNLPVSIFPKMRLLKHLPQGHTTTPSSLQGCWEPKVRTLCSCGN